LPSTTPRQTPGQTPNQTQTPGPTLPPLPTFTPQDALIREFTNYLGILKAVHSGADLQASAAAVGSSLPQSARGYLGYVTSHIGDNQILPFIEAAVEARAEIAPALTGNRWDLVP
jgi:alpha-glucan,water dikinase